MAKLNQIVAVVNGKKTETQKELTSIYRKCDSATLFSGLTRVYTPLNEDGEGPTPKFKTWKEALTAQKEWNKKCPGHVARKRKKL